MAEAPRTPGGVVGGPAYWPKRGTLPVAPIERRLHPNQGILWLASYPRSGNTWLRTFINNLLDIQYGQTPNGINAIGRATIWEAGIDGFRAILGRDPFSVETKALSKARPRVQELLASKAGGRLFLKTHLAAIKVDGEFAINWSVTRGAIYVVRNPLDVACSYAPHYGISIDEAIQRMGTRDLWAYGKTMVPERVGSWSQNVASWTAENLPLKVHVMRFEDMVSKGVETFSQFVKYVGTGISDEQVALAVEASSFAQVKQQENDTGFHERPVVSSDAFFRKGKVGQWRDVLTRDQIDRVVRDHSVVMKRFGYETEV